MTTVRQAALVAGLLMVGATSSWAQEATRPAHDLEAAAPTTVSIVASAERALAKSMAASPAKSARKGDSTGNGIAAGAAIGGLGMLGVMAYVYSQCDAGCDAPEFKALGLPVAAMGAGVGAVVGYIIDRAK
jgi:hypothetical protein